MNIIYDMLSHGADTNDPYKIVVHSMAERIDNNGDIYEARDWLDFLGWSAHALVKPDGDIIVCRSDDQGAYHAKGHNTDSLGIEFLVPGTHDYGTFLEAIKEDCWTPRQYNTGAEFIMGWKRMHDIQLMVRHSDVSPGRKVDPGAGFRWHWLRTQVGMV